MSAPDVELAEAPVLPDTNSDEWASYEHSLWEFWRLLPFDTQVRYMEQALTDWIGDLDG